MAHYVRVEKNTYINADSFERIELRNENEEKVLYARFNSGVEIILRGTDAQTVLTALGIDVEK